MTVGAGGRGGGGPPAGGPGEEEIHLSIHNTTMRVTDNTPPLTVGVGGRGGGKPKGGPDQERIKSNYKTMRFSDIKRNKGHREIRVE